MTKSNRILMGLLALVLAAGAARTAAFDQAPQAAKPAPPKPAPTGQQAPAPPAVAPSDYVIGTDDVLIVMFRREKDMSAEAVVRPDGRITLPLLNDLQAAGLTPDQLRIRVTEESMRLLKDPPEVTVIVKQINSRKVFITGQVGRPGSYPIGDRMTVMQLISLAGGLSEYAKKKDIVILREGGARPAGKPATFRFNYEDVVKLKNLASNIDLRPGDTVIVP
jgi:polysaccharide export outer membrane protein